jgi:hypothetical protein
MTETNLPEDGIQPCAEESENPLPSHVVVLEGTGLIISVSSADLAIAEERGANEDSIHGSNVHYFSPIRLSEVGTA